MSSEQPRLGTDTIRGGPVKSILLFDSYCIVLQVLSRALSRLGSDLDSNIRGGPVKKRVINPKSVTMDDLYGRLNSETSEYQDGLISSAMRGFSQVTIFSHLTY